MTSIVLKRRSILKSAALGGVAASFPLSASAALKPLIVSLAATDIRLPDFSLIIDEQVTVKTAEGVSHAAVVCDVSELQFKGDSSYRPEHVRTGATIVRFDVENAEQFYNDVHQIEHPRLGKMDLLLSVVPDAHGIMGLEAVFN